MASILYILLGLVAGVLGGMFGIGGATILVPALVFIFGLTQHQAQGTSLAALLPPVGILAVLHYYSAGNVKFSIAGFICIGFLIGGLIGANLAHSVPDPLLKRLFGFYLLFIALNMVFAK